MNGSPAGSTANQGSAFNMAADAARAYEAAVTVFMAPFADIAIEAAGIGAGDHVLDLACGTGVVTSSTLGVSGQRASISRSTLEVVDLPTATEPPTPMTNGVRSVRSPRKVVVT